MLGTIVNAAAVLIGGGVGLLLKRGLPKRVSDAIMGGVALLVTYIGIDGVLYFLGFKDSYLGEQGRF